MKTKIFTYYYDTEKQEDREKYRALCDRMDAAGVKCFETWGRGSHYLGEEMNGKTVTLETDFLFSNQWNTAPDAGSKTGLRVFDWAQDYMIQGRKEIKKGHYLEITGEMKAIRENTRVCGYCGHYSRGPEHPAFCTDCLDSEYLKEEDLHLLRLLPVALASPTRTPLTDAERAQILPLYVSRQTAGSNSRAVAKREKQYKDICEKYETETTNAKKERDGFLWLLDHNLNIENWIFYNHTGKFCLGWRSPIASACVGEWHKKLEGFPFSFEITE